MKKLMFVVITFALFLLASCGDSAKKPLHQKEPQTARSNIVKTPVPEAQKVIEKFYQDINKQKYQDAASLLGPQLKFEGQPEYSKYLKNMKQVTITKLVDISNDSGPIDPNYKQYFAIKVYYGELNIKVQDPNLVPTLGGKNYRRFILIKENRDSPWLIDTDENTPKRES
ncbi:DUF4829 domain-containing protein [Geobacillus icigianus]|uniref:DUF4829 domain-containing protein n=2 Tax=Geobacillus TaxID=129337 RepID=A0A679G1P7_9BACL|nr:MULTISPECIES: DUF4829 domain-containing protein [Geobacillus]BBW97921.1 hypothetical protein GsuE55_27540 [Geobacillus subterraneus]